MALQNGIVNGNQYKKLQSYPDLNSDTQSVLKGNGTWTKPAFTSDTIEGGVRLTWADGAVAGTIPSGIETETYTRTTNSAGELVYTRANGSVAFTIPLASGS